MIAITYVIEGITQDDKPILHNLCPVHSFDLPLLLINETHVVNDYIMHYDCLQDSGNILGRANLLNEVIIMDQTEIEIALQERVKELNCLYGMARLAEEHHGSMEKFLKCLADFLPSSWRYADVACARISFHGETFSSKKFSWTEWRQSSPICVDDKQVGDVTIIYLESRPIADEGPFLKEERVLLEEVAKRIGEITVWVMAEQELQENNKQLLLERESLQEANAALRVILSNIEDEKRRIYENIQLNIDKVVMPILHALTPAIAKNKQKYMEILRTNLEELTSPFTSRILNHFRALTPAEVNICNMIRNGLRTKEIADLRGVSTATISRHRERIRRKLKLTNEQINLTNYLQSIQTVGVTSGSGTLGGMR
jgi:DNA-binding NarL/FixJ family response regulator